MIKFTKEEKKRIRTQLNSFYENKKDELGAIKNAFNFATKIINSVGNFKKDKDLIQSQKRAAKQVKEGEEKMELLKKFTDFINETLK